MTTENLKRSVSVYDLLSQQDSAPLKLYVIQNDSFC